MVWSSQLTCIRDVVILRDLGRYTGCLLNSKPVSLLVLTEACNEFLLENMHLDQRVTSAIVFSVTVCEMTSY